MESNRIFHTVGIIPVEKRKSIFGYAWDDALMPLDNQFTALHRAVLECAAAGCESIWINCNNDKVKLIRHTIGEYVEDPVYYYRHYATFGSEHKRYIPIFYCPNHPNDIDKRDSYSWGIINAAMNANRSASRISRHLIPNKFYVAFPFGVYNPWVVQKHRREITSQQNFYLSCDGKTVKDGEYLGFTFNQQDLKAFKEHVRKTNAPAYKALSEFKSGGKWMERQPANQRYSARFFTIDKIVESFIIEGAHEGIIDWHYRIDGWDKYRAFLASDKSTKMPKRKIFHMRPLGKMNNTVEAE
jgi:hypothetical protein